ncbi:hypothetical protein LXA43DRAFT_430451 [Ganoderma leucocontextum]|nr:hypothetical protein LXA43DRAFT_430451 [Ganoderma leucocontextum]
MDIHITPLMFRRPLSQLACSGGFMACSRLSPCYQFSLLRNAVLGGHSLPQSSTLFTSTTIYVVTYALSSQSTIMETYISSVNDLWDTGNVFIDYPLDAALRLVKDYSGLQSCVCTAALTINITLADAIVCWRACTIWHKNRVVRVACGVFLLATFVLGVINTTWTCQSPEDTNLLATLLVGYKAWESRRRLRGYLVAGGSQVEKLFALLIESGAVYCAIWGIVVAYEIIAYDSIPSNMPAVGFSFFDIFSILFDGALAPVVTIYPTIIIVLVALNRSHIEKGLSQHLESLPTPHIAVTVNTIMTSERTPHRMSEVLVIDSDGQGLGFGDGVEDSDASTRRTSNEWKADAIA